MSSPTFSLLLGAANAFVYALAIASTASIGLSVILGQRARATVVNRVGVLGFVWLSFVLGQGILSVTWLLLSLAGAFYAWQVWAFLFSSFALAAIFSTYQRARLREWLQDATSRLCEKFPLCWSSYLSLLVFVVILLAFLLALLPTGIDDALRWYIALPRLLAVNGKLVLLPALSPYYGLQPLQAEMHWAALFAISNETAVTVWDLLCGLSFLSGVGILAQRLLSSGRAAFIASAIVLSSSGFYYLLGGAKPDNAGAQYGIAAFVWLILWPEVGRRLLVFGGLCMGWSIASRYTNIVCLPAFAVFAGMAVPRVWRLSAYDSFSCRKKSFWIAATFAAGLATVVAAAPMFFKNWLLLGCPLAPVYGCQNTVWAGVQWAKQAITVHNRSGISVPNLFAYPFVWTFSLRKDMLGNVSPLLLGFVPLWFLYKRVSSARSGYIAGSAGLLSVITWWLIINQLFPYPRWILVPMALLAICVSAAVAAAENDPEMPKLASWLVRGSIVLLLLFLAFQSRGAVYGIRYLAGIDSRESGYRSKPGFDVATWLNTHLTRGERVAFAGWNGFVYFVNPDHVLNSESANDLEGLWQICRCVAPEAWTPEIWRFYAERGFNYAVVSNGLVAEALATSIDGMKIAVAFSGREEAVLRINKVANSSKAHVSLSHYG